MKKEKTLITALLQLDPAKRMSAEKVLRHKWYATVDRTNSGPSLRIRCGCCFPS